MNAQLNKSVFDPSRRPVLPRTAARKFSSHQSPGLLLSQARRLIGVSRQTLAAEMGISNSLLRKYETRQLRIPNSVLLKIFIFGLDFWTDGIAWQTTCNDEASQKQADAPAPEEETSEL